MISVSEQIPWGFQVRLSSGFPRCNPTAVVLSCEWLKSLPMQMSVILGALGSLSDPLGASSSLVVRLVRDGQRHLDPRPSDCRLGVLGLPERSPFLQSQLAAAGFLYNQSALGEYIESLRALLLQVILYVDGRNSHVTCP